MIHGAHHNRTGHCGFTGSMIRRARISEVTAHDQERAMRAGMPVISARGAKTAAISFFCGSLGGGSGPRRLAPKSPRAFVAYLDGATPPSVTILFGAGMRLLCSAR